MIPRAIYRLQFQKAFTFADAARLAPYFKTLSVSHIYSSPILASRAGSAHGYDATHDHKRGEDVRARLAVLSECAVDWEEETARWFELNARFRAPDVNSADEYQLYQTLAGTWPADFTPDDERIGRTPPTLFPGTPNARSRDRRA